jgi:hypothetical protein
MVSSAQKWKWLVPVMVIATGLIALGASGEEVDRFHPRLSVEEARAAWELQARHVASKLDLPDEKIDQLIDTYEDTKTRLAKVGMARAEKVHEDFATLRAKLADPRSLPEHLTDRECEELREALSALMDEKIQAMAERRAVEKERFGKAVATFLTKDQTEVVVSRLGSFNKQWDFMVHTIAGFDLGEKLFTALETINVYAMEYAKVRETAFGESEEDFLELSTKLTGIKLARDHALAELLSEDQLVAWKKATAEMGPGRGPLGQFVVGGPVPTGGPDEE